MSTVPDPTASLLQRAVGLHQQGRFDDAAALYQQVLERDPHQVDALHLSGVMAKQRGDAGAAVALIERALAIDPRHARAHANLGAALSALGETDKALRSYEQAIALDPAYALAHSNRGNALRSLGRLDEALASYERALQLQPAAVDAASGRAIALNDQGRYAEALRSAELALAQQPRYIEAWAARGNALAGMGHFTDALSCFEQAVALGGERADLAAWRGAAHARLGRFEQALAGFDASLALRPQHAGTALRRAHALDALGRRDDAAAAFRHAGLLGADAGQVAFSLAALDAAPTPAAAPAAYVTALFDQYAGHFDAHLVDTLAYRTPQLIAAALARTGTDKGNGSLQVADLGCGTGLCAPLLRPLAAHLAGVDLSPAMLEQARARALYDELACADIAAWLAGHAGTLDLIVAADVFVYIGDLSEVFGRARQALRDGGRFCFSVESSATDDFQLQPSRRYAHGAAHVRALAAAHGFTVADAVSATLRRDRGTDIAGEVLVLQT